jgi:hypothetical protein
MKGKAELKSSTGRAHGMRYEGSFLMRCLLLKLKNSATYENMRKNKILPLPSPDTLRRQLSSSPCKFGFNELALENIQQELRRNQNWKNKPQRRWGTLMWDEISLKKDISWQANRLEWHGVVDFGPDIKTAAQNGIATHCLVLMFRPYLGSWIQPIACFATLNAASGTLLYEIVTKAIVLLYNHDAIVKSTVCDGCSTNKSAMQMFKVCGEGPIARCICSFPHPMDQNIKIYWLIDVPHLLKCTRNQIFNHKRVQV